jgi:hypothetical protein
MPSARGINMGSGAISDHERVTMISAPELAAAEVIKKILDESIAGPPEMCRLFLN